MIKIISTKLIVRFLILKFRFFGKNPSININEHLAKVQRILIYMPNKIVPFAAALKTLESLRKKSVNWKITVITKLETVDLIQNRLKVNILPYSSKDFNFLGLPKSSINRHFNNLSYDLALDFNLGLDLLCITLFQLSGAPLKVCIDSKEKAHLYNFRIRVNAAESLEKKYNVMIKYVTAMADFNHQELSVSKPIQKLK
ncbi:MAG: hypothetical protein ACE5JB_08365 [bacterium]